MDEWHECQKLNLAWSAHGIVTSILAQIKSDSEVERKVIQAVSVTGCSKIPWRIMPLCLHHELRVDELKLVCQGIRNESLEVIPNYTSLLCDLIPVPRLISDAKEDF